MKRKPLLPILSLLFIIQFGTSQQLLPTVISSSGGFYSSASGMLSFTTGELAAIETYVSQSFILTQGFQQSWDFGTSTEDHLISDFSLEIFPIPSDGYLNMVIQSDLESEVNVRVLDILGRETARFNFHHESGTQIETLDLASEGPGLYFVLLSGKTNVGQVLTPVITKIQIIK